VTGGHILASSREEKGERNEEKGMRIEDCGNIMVTPADWSKEE